MAPKGRDLQGRGQQQVQAGWDLQAKARLQEGLGADLELKTGIYHEIPNTPLNWRRDVIYTLTAGPAGRGQWCWFSWDVWAPTSCFG